MGSTVTFDARVLACDSCGAPLVLRAAQGQEACRYCGETSVAASVRQGVPRCAALPEAQRIGGLRQQAGRRIQLPEAVAELLPGGQLVPWQVPAALDLWNASRRSLTAAARTEAEDVLASLSLPLADHFADAGEPLRARALLESAAEALSLPRHRQAMFAGLARHAAREGDSAAAASWLSMCDPAPHDIESDTAFRFALASLATANNDPARVLATLGATGQDVPIAPEHEGACAVLRSNALEKSGQVPQAIDVLDAFMLSAGGVARYQAARFVERHASWQLSERSAPEADRRQRSRGVRLAGASAGVPLFAFAMAAASLALGAVSLLLAFVSVVAAASVAFFLWMMTALTVAIGFVDLFKWRRARRIRNKGTSALGQVLHVSFTGTATMGVSEMRYRLLVMPLGGLPFEAFCELHAKDDVRTQLLPGAVVAARLDPSDPARATIELD